MAGTLRHENDGLTVQFDGAPGISVSAPATSALDTLPESGAVVLGVRPEHITTSPATGAPPDIDGFDVIVELAEPLGHEQLLHLRVEGVSIIARGAPGVRPEPGSRIRVTVEHDRVHLFDALSGVSLRRA